MRRSATRVRPETSHSLEFGMPGLHDMNLEIEERREQLAAVARMVGADADAIRLSFLCEAWRADLFSGVITLGPQATAMHGIDAGSCGIINLMRAYDPVEWPKILRIIEDASRTDGTFCFSATILLRPSLHRPVFCAGESALVGNGGGFIKGLFAFSRLCVETSQAGFRKPN